MIRLVFIFNLLILSLFANVKLQGPNSFLNGEVYIFSIEAVGSDIKFPKLEKIDGNIVNEVASSSSTNIINGKFSSAIKKSYSIFAKTEFTIPSLKFIVDGQEVYTKEKRVVIDTPRKTNSSVFDLSIKADKNELYVGENFVLTLVFKFRKDAQIVDLDLKQPDFDGFWYKQLDNTKKYSQGNFEVQELNFLLFPLKSGNLKINPININASIVDMNRNFNSFFSTPTKTLKIYSNELNFDIKSLPQGVNLIGDFDIEASVDKTKLKQNEALSYKVKISGYGNLEDIKEIKLNLPNATVYENKAKIESKYINGLYKGVYTKTFSIVPDGNINIPPLTLKYFNKQENKIVYKKTKDFNITIEDEKKQERIKLQKQDIKTKEVIKIVEKTSILDKFLYFFLGVIVCILIIGLYLYVIKQRDIKKFNESSLIKKIKSSKNKSDLLKVLAVYINKDKNLDKLIFDLEKSDNIDLIKKEIIKLLKNINFKG